MNKIKKIIEFIQQFDYVIRIAKAALAGFETFTTELNKGITNEKDK